MHKGLGSQRLVALFAGGWVLFNFPLLGLWDRDATVWGIPVFPAALFMLWLVLIVALAWLVDRPPVRDDDAPLSAPASDPAPPSPYLPHSPSAQSTAQPPALPSPPQA